MTAGNRKSQPTLKDVAALANVDTSVVSRVINGDKRLRISDETRERVFEAIRQAGYRKNLVALGLRTGRTGMIACVVPDLTTPSYAPIVDAAQARAHEEGYTLLVVTASPGNDSAGEFRRLLDERRVDGLLVGSGVIGDEGTADLIRGAGPIVVFNRLVEGAECSVVLDEEAAARRAARYLVRLGHKRCALLAGPPELETTQRRWRSFSDALAEQGCPPPNLFCAEQWTAAAGWQAAQELFAAPERATAVYAASGLLHIGLIVAASERGIGVPDELSVIAHHDSEANRFATPPVTAFQLPLGELGATAAALLLRRIRGETTPAVKVIRRPAPVLIERGSVSAYPNSQASRRAARTT